MVHTVGLEDAGPNWEYIYCNELCVFDKLRVDYTLAWSPIGNKRSIWLKPGPVCVYIYIYIHTHTHTQDVIKKYTD